MGRECYHGNKLSTHTREGRRFCGEGVLPWQQTVHPYQRGEVVLWGGSVTMATNCPPIPERGGGSVGRECYHGNKLSTHTREGRRFCGEGVLPWQQTVHPYQRGEAVLWGGSVTMATNCPPIPERGGGSVGRECYHGNKPVHPYQRGEAVLGGRECYHGNKPVHSGQAVIKSGACLRSYRTK